MGARCEKTHKRLISGCPYCAADEALAKVGRLRRAREAEIGRLRAKVKGLREELDEDERSAGILIDECDGFASTIAEVHRALGGDGEWCARPGQTLPAGETGDLSIDCPALAEQLRADVAKLHRVAGCRDGESTEDAVLRVRRLRNRATKNAAKRDELLDAVKFAHDNTECIHIREATRAALEEHEEGDDG